MGIVIRRRQFQWYRHVGRQDKKKDIRRVAELEIMEINKHGSSRQLWQGTINVDMERWILQKCDTNNRVNWR